MGEASSFKLDVPFLSKIKLILILILNKYSLLIKRYTGTFSLIKLVMGFDPSLIHGTLCLVFKIIII